MKHLHQKFNKLLDTLPGAASLSLRETEMLKGIFFSGASVALAKDNTPEDIEYMREQVKEWARKNQNG